MTVISRSNAQHINWHLQFMRLISIGTPSNCHNSSAHCRNYKRFHLSRGAFTTATPKTPLFSPDKHTPTHCLCTRRSLSPSQNRSCSNARHHTTRNPKFILPDNTVADARNHNVRNAEPSLQNFWILSPPWHSRESRNPGIEQAQAKPQSHHCLRTYSTSFKTRKCLFWTTA